ncbi:MAG: hypothetical protein EXS64_08995 [Candidatus Latescibacteria bacterium]|nr:hypothetical protein [Candidatus Latescibacterota bacterium]
MFKAGSARVNITPFVGGPMAGYAARTRGSETVDDELFAKALVLDDGRTKTGIVTSDLIGVPPELAAEVRDLVAQETGISGDHLLLCASHTHFGPAVRRQMFRENEATDAPQDQAYLTVLARKLATAVHLAHDGRRAARAGAGKGEIHTISYNRRTVRPDGKVEMHLRYPPPGTDVTFGPKDPEVNVLKVEDAAGGVMATLVSFGCHPVSSVDRTYAITADYPGYAMGVVEEVEGGVCLFALGCAGNVVPIQREGRSKVQVGRSLGGRALDVFQWIRTTDEVRLAAMNRKIRLPLKVFPSVAELEAEVARLEAEAAKGEGEKVSGEDLRGIRNVLGRTKGMLSKARRFEGQTHLETEIQAIAVGESQVVGLPGEVFAETGMDIKQRSGIPNTFVFSLSNDTPGYIPIRHAFWQGGYESDVSSFGPGAAEEMADEALGLVRECRAKM